MESIRHRALEINEELLGRFEPGNVNMGINSGIFDLTSNEIAYFWMDTNSVRFPYRATGDSPGFLPLQEQPGFPARYKGE